MPFHFAPPSSRLAPFVRQYWALEATRPDGFRHVQALVPNGLAEIGLYLARRPAALSNRAELGEDTLITGQQAAPYDIAMRGSVSLFSITLTPMGAARFLGMPISELTGRTVPLDATGRIGAAHVRQEMADAGDFAARVRIAERFLLARLVATAPAPDSARIARAVAAIDSTGGQIGVPALAALACLSVKQFERSFAETIGLRPKQFLRIVRFQRAIHHRATHPGDLTTLAHAAGYYDQSHMIGEFRALSGLTPRQYFAVCVEPSDYFATLPAGSPALQQAESA